MKKAKSLFCNSDDCREARIIINDLLLFFLMTDSKIQKNQTKKKNGRVNCFRRMVGRKCSWILIRSWFVELSLLFSFFFFVVFCLFWTNLSQTIAKFFNSPTLFSFSLRSGHLVFIYIFLTLNWISFMQNFSTLGIIIVQSVYKRKSAKNGSNQDQAMKTQEWEQVITTGGERWKNKKKIQDRSKYIFSSAGLFFCPFLVILVFVSLLV